MKLKSFGFLGLITLPLIPSCSNTQAFHIDERSIDVESEFVDNPTTSTWDLVTRTLTIKDDNYFFLSFEILEEYTGIVTEGSYVATGCWLFMLLDGMPFPNNFEQYAHYEYDVLWSSSYLLKGKCELFYNNSPINRLWNYQHGKIRDGFYNIWIIFDTYYSYGEGNYFVSFGNKYQNLFTLNIINDIDV